MTRRLLVGAGLATLLLVLGASAAMLLATHSPPDGLEVSGGELEIGEVADADTSLLDGFSKPGSVVYSVEAGENGGPYQLRFKLSAGLPANPSRLVAANRDGGEEMWALSEGQIIGNHLVVQGSHLSQWQLRVLRGGVSLPSAAGVERAIGAPAEPPRCEVTATGFDLEVHDRNGILLSPCIDFADGTTLKIANNRLVPLEFDAPGVRLRLLPSAGAASISIPKIPTELRFHANPDAAILDLALALIARGKSQTTDAKGLEAVECMRSQPPGIAGDDRAPDKDSITIALATLIGQCGKAIEAELGPDVLARIGFALGLPQLADGIWDAIRNAGTAEARVRVGTLAGQLRPRKLSPKTVVVPGRSCGVLEGVFEETDNGVALEMGVARGTVSCGEIEAAIGDYLEATGPCAQLGAGTCWRQIGRWRCVAPTYSLYPIGVSCDDETGTRVVGIDRATIAGTYQRSCGTPPHTEPPGPFDVSANFDCEAAQRIAAGSLEPAGVYPYVCRVETTGYESSAHTCRFGDSSLAFATGV